MKTLNPKRVSAVEERERLRKLHDEAMKDDDATLAWCWFLSGAMNALDYIIEGKDPPSEQDPAEYC